MKKISIIIISVLLGFVACSVPVIIENKGKNYETIKWEGGNFFFITYHWKGGKFDDAVDLIKKWIDLTKSRNLGEYSIGRFPANNEWQLGIISAKGLEISEFEGFKIEKITVSSGDYASLKAKGYPENIFYHWESFKKLLLKDRYEVLSPVFEIYKTAFDMKIPITERIGELRYQIKPVK